MRADPASREVPLGLRRILALALPLWRQGYDTHTIAWFLTIDGEGIVHESQVARALARYRDGSLSLEEAV